MKAAVSERNDSTVSAKDLIIGKNGETGNRALAGTLLWQFGGKRVGVHVVLSGILEKRKEMEKKRRQQKPKRHELKIL